MPEKTNLVFRWGRGKILSDAARARLPSEVSAVVIYCAVVECDAAERQGVELRERLKTTIKSYIKRVRAGRDAATG